MTLPLPTQLVLQSETKLSIQCTPRHPKNIYKNGQNPTKISTKRAETRSILGYSSFSPPPSLFALWPKTIHRKLSKNKSSRRRRESTERGPVLNKSISVHPNIPLSLRNSAYFLIGFHFICLVFFSFFVLRIVFCVRAAPVPVLPPPLPPS